ncbi:MAG: hypothetical protein HY763_03575 [Planctomycetes bacterium]|nr:hypothetical protein [Planctomycetota bacterium]
MVSESGKTLQDLVERVGKYSEEAYLFVRDGLSYTSAVIHGPEPDAHRQLHTFLSENDLDWKELAARYHDGSLPPPVVRAIDEAGGCEKLNRHVSGRELSWGLRDLALQRWGMLARTVLESWGLRSTADFGAVVYGFIEFKWMQKQPQDRIDDFQEVYSFDEAFQYPFRPAQHGADREKGVA